MCCLCSELFRDSVHRMSTNLQTMVRLVIDLCISTVAVLIHNVCNQLVVTSCHLCHCSLKIMNTPSMIERKNGCHLGVFCSAFPLSPGTIMVDHKRTLVVASYFCLAIQRFWHDQSSDRLGHNSNSVPLSLQKLCLSPSLSLLCPNPISLVEENYTAAALCSWLGQEERCFCKLSLTDSKCAQGYY